MSASASRLSRIGVCYGIGLCLVLAHLAVVMVWQHDEWLVRSYRNRWAFRDVPSVRGTLLDRFDRELAVDEPIFELGCVYERFRLLHPVGAAVHGATEWTRVRDGVETRFCYLDDALDGALGPAAAVRELLAMPVATLFDRRLEKEQRQQLAQAVTTVLAACADVAHREVRKALRAAAAASPHAAVATVLAGVPPARLVEQFAAILGRLHAVDAALQAAAGRGIGSGGDGTRTLLECLDRFRIECLDGRRTEREAKDGTVIQGELFERLARPVLRRVPFELAAALRLAAADQPGLRLEPSLERVRTQLDDVPTLQAILGGVVDVDRAANPADLESYLGRRIDDELVPELDDLVPDELAPTPRVAELIRDDARASYRRVLLLRERRGSSGLEARLHDRLVGAPGLRLVEHDARSREQRLWSSLRVEAGSDVALTVDLDLQRSLERHVAAAAAHWRGVARARGVREDLTDAAAAVIDARTGDVLALAGAPATLDGDPRVPAVLTWRGNGAVGSLVKPLFLVEQRIAERDGLPHHAVSTFFGCDRIYPRRVGGRTLACDHAHGARGLDPVEAIALSCNTFFFQVAEGLEEAGLRRALWRFGMLAAPAGDGGARHQPRPAELPPGLAAAPRFFDNPVLPMRGIGYGIGANPLSLARAYAALATGALPTLGFVRGERRPHFALGATDEDLAIVRAGLQGCVEHGTAAGIDALARLGVAGKTGTAEIGIGGATANNAWFAGWLPPAGDGATQLVVCAVVYTVPDKVHGADAAGQLLADWLDDVQRDAVLAQRWLPPEVPR